MKGFGKENNFKKKSIVKVNSFDENIINQAINSHIQGNIEEAFKTYQYLIEKDVADHRVYSNCGARSSGASDLLAL